MDLSISLLRFISKATTNVLMRTKRGHQKARTVGLPERRAECRFAECQDLLERVRRERYGIGFDDTVQRVMDKSAAVRGARIGVDRVERPQA